MLNASVARLTTPESERIVRLGAERHAQELKKELKAVHQQMARSSASTDKVSLNFNALVCLMMPGWRPMKTTWSGAVGRGARRS